MCFSRWLFRSAGVYGLAVLLPQYFMEDQIGREYPPALTHPEYFYGFVGVALAWQLAFLLIGQDPVRYRPLMVPAILEKASFGVAAIVLWTQQRLPDMTLAFAAIDLAWGALFVAAFWRLSHVRSDSRDRGP